MTFASVVVIGAESRDALSASLEHERGDDPGPLFWSFGGDGLQRQPVDRLLKQLAAQANSKLPTEEPFGLSAHVRGILSAPALSRPPNSARIAHTPLAGHWAI